ncbi:MAG: Maf family protein [Anaerolineae bacterium]|nr:Maf family protein [Anaerolineae bacterium]
MNSQLSTPPIILASASPRRRELLAQLGVAFEVRPSNVNEDPLPDETPLQTQHRITRAKAAAAHVLADDAVVIAADTTVLLDGEMLNKPDDEAEAWAMLRRLRGRAHEVQTCLVQRQNGVETVDVMQSQVQMRPYDDDEIAAYIASGDPFDKAGAYAVQHASFNPVAEIRGCPLNVVGLPLCKLRQFQQQPFVCGVGTVPCAGNECGASPL